MQAELSAKYLGIAERIEALGADRVRRLPVSAGQLGFEVDADALIDVCTALRDDEATRFEQLMDVCGVDYLAYGDTEWHGADATGTGFSRGVERDTGGVFGGEHDDAVRYAPAGRFAAVYHLQSITHNSRVRLRAFCPDDARPILPSVVGIWNSAEWYEREAFDLYGILFRGHPDLRRILTDYGFIGHPFRKDFPLSGHVEMRYDPEKGRVIYEPVSIEPRTLVPKVIRHDARYEHPGDGGGDA